MHNDPARNDMGTNSGEAVAFMHELLETVPWGQVDSQRLLRLRREMPRVAGEFVRFVGNGGRCDAEGLAKATDVVPEPIIEVIDLPIDQALSLEELREAGRYGYVDPRITSANFSSGQIAEGMELVRTRFNRTLGDTSVAFAERQQLGINPVPSPPYIATLGVKRPDVQQTGDTLDIDAVCEPTRGYHGCLVLPRMYDRREFRLFGVQMPIYGHNWILGLRPKAIPRAA